MPKGPQVKHQNPQQFINLPEGYAGGYPGPGAYIPQFDQVETNMQSGYASPQGEPPVTREEWFRLQQERQALLVAERQLQTRAYLAMQVLASTTGEDREEEIRQLRRSAAKILNQYLTGETKPTE